MYDQGASVWECRLINLSATLPTVLLILADRQGRPLCLRVTGGPRRDRTQARALVTAWTDAPRSCLIADRAYDVDACRAARRGRA